IYRIFTIVGVLLFCSVTDSAALNFEIDPQESIGLNVELGGAVDPDVIGGHAGICGYVTPVLSLKGGFSFLASEDFDDFFGGLELAMRASFPTRISPFVGLGLFAGYSNKYVSADEDGIDNDGDGEVDESGEEDKVIDNVLASIYPEAGSHFWITDFFRLTLTAEYHYTTEGRDHDYLIYRVGFSFIFSTSEKISDE
ncbi:hypothetical protein ACFL27_04820, partial [candidate division CSSED10-310 bacterium]